MIITKQDLKSFNHVHRLNIVNSISGVKQACLIGTKSKNGKDNLGLFNSIFHIGSDPGLLGFVMRPSKDVRRDTLENIIESGYYTINHVHQSILVNSHYTSAKIESEKSEFTSCNLTPEYVKDFPAPFVGESYIRIGMRFLEQMPIKYNGTTIIVGQIECVEFPNSIINEKGLIDFDMAKNVVVSGLNKYYQVGHILDMPYARPNQIPKF
ncbi:MAG: flavin reductase family protein [Salibacteraceae bacterium]